MVRVNLIIVSIYVDYLLVTGVDEKLRKELKLK